MPMGKTAMKCLRYLIAASALAFTLPAQAGTLDPEVIIYRGSGILDSGGTSFVGYATAFMCTPFSGVSENIRFVVRGNDGAIKANQAIVVAHLNTVTASTKQVDALTSQINLVTGSVLQGTVAIAATSTSVTCTAMMLSATTTPTIAAMLHMTRFNPLSATEE